LKRFLVLGTIALAWLYPVAASADSLAFDGVGKGVWGINIGGSVVNVNDVFAGQIDWSWLTAPPAGFGATLETYCVDVLHDVTNPETVTVRSTDDIPSTAPNVSNAGEKAAWLYDSYASTITTNAQAAGLQIAIWEALYDTTADLAGGNINFSGAGLTLGVLTAANSYLSALYAADYSTASAVWLDSPTGQDQITNVPEPATLLLFALGIGTVVQFRRKSALGKPVARCTLA
jgi:hypothetical protein